MTHTAARPVPYGLYIDGDWTDGSSSEVLTVVNPATEEQIGFAPQGTVADVQQAIRAARRAFDEGPWPQMSARQRSKALCRMAELLRARYDELVALSVAPISETGDKAEVLAEFARGDGARERLTYAMQFERGEWRIDDITYAMLDGETHTLRGVLAAN